MRLLGAQEHSVKVDLDQVGYMIKSNIIEEAIFWFGLVAGDFSFESVYDVSMLEADCFGISRASSGKHEDGQFIVFLATT